MEEGENKPRDTASGWVSRYGAENALAKRPDDRFRCGESCGISNFMLPKLSVSTVNSSNFSYSASFVMERDWVGD